MGVMAGKAVAIDDGFVAIAPGIFLPLMAAETEFLDGGLNKILAIAVAGVAAAVVQGAMASPAQEFHERGAMGVVTGDAACLVPCQGLMGGQEFLIVKIMAVGAKLITVPGEHEPVFIAVIKMAACAVVFFERIMSAFAAA
jgi:hypothetical protein